MRRTALVLPVILAIAASTASECEDSEESNETQVQQNTQVEVVTRSGSAEAVQQVVVIQSESHGVEFVRSPFCEPDVVVAENDQSAQGSITCIGYTENRERVVAVFVGSVYSSSCDGSLTVKVDDDTVFVTNNLSGCSVEDAAN